MQDFDLFIPMLFHMFHVVIIMFASAHIRRKAVFGKDVSIKYFKTYSDGECPDHVRKWSNHLNNHFETPVIFYTLCIMHTFMQTNSSITLLLAWSWVGFRIAHSIVHLGKNNVVHRLYVFALSVFCLVGIMITLLMRLTDFKGAVL